MKWWAPFDLSWNSASIYAKYRFWNRLLRFLKILTSIFHPRNKPTARCRPHQSMRTGVFYPGTNFQINPTPLTLPSRAILDHTPPNFRLFAKIWNIRFGIENVPKEFCRTTTSCVFPQKLFKASWKSDRFANSEVFRSFRVDSTKNSTRLAVSTFLSLRPAST